MPDMIVIGFHGLDGATSALGELQRIAYDDASVGVADAVAVFRGKNGTLHLQQATGLTDSEGAVSGLMLGAMVGAVRAIPFTGGTSAAVTATLVTGAMTGGALGAAAGELTVDRWRKEYGVSEAFVRGAAALIPPSDSALFALLHAAQPEKLAEQFRGRDGTILRTTLPPEESAKLQRLLDGHRAAD
jgi:uncharacterized membrane protein